jgi:hypothetical protein
MNPLPSFNNHTILSLEKREPVRLWRNPESDVVILNEVKNLRQEDRRKAITSLVIPAEVPESKQRTQAENLKSYPTSSNCFSYKVLERFRRWRKRHHSKHKICTP